jgi:hypothetical protein
MDPSGAVLGRPIWRPREGARGLGGPSRYLAVRSGSERLGAATSARGRQRPKDAATSAPAPCRETAGLPAMAKKIPGKHRCHWKSQKDAAEPWEHSMDE